MMYISDYETITYWYMFKSICLATFVTLNWLLSVLGYLMELSGRINENKDMKSSDVKYNLIWVVCGI